MTKYFLISSKMNRRFLLVAGILFLFGFYFLFFVTVLIFVLILYLFRRKQVDISLKRMTAGNMIISPISGVFLGDDDTENGRVMMFRVLPWHNYGLYLPVAGEVVDAKALEAEKQGKADNFTLLKNKTGNMVKLSYYGFLNLISPKVYIKDGDKGVVGSVFGVLPFGGRVYLGIPKDCEILVKRGEKVRPSETIIANFKDIE